MLTCIMYVVLCQKVLLRPGLLSLRGAQKIMKEKHTPSTITVNQTLHVLRPLCAVDLSVTPDRARLPFGYVDCTGRCILRVNKPLETPHQTQMLFDMQAIGFRDEACSSACHNLAAAAEACTCLQDNLAVL